MNLSLYSGRKFLGPLDRAPINGLAFCKGIMRQAMLEKLVEEYERYKDITEDEKIPEMEKKLAKMVLEQIDVQLQEFLGIPQHDESEPSTEISR